MSVGNEQLVGTPLGDGSGWAIDGRRKIATNGSPYQREAIASRIGTVAKRAEGVVAIDQHIWSGERVRRIDILHHHDGGIVHASIGVVGNLKRIGAWQVDVQEE